MINKTELINRISAYITDQHEKITKNDLKKAITTIYDELVVIKTKKTKNNIDKPLSIYNKFMKEQMEVLKNDPNNKMTSKEKMKHIGFLWKQHKEQKL
jgi:ribosomal protein S17E